MADNPYVVLGVPKDATNAEIKRVYRKLARQYHPDRNPGDAAAEEKFKSIQAAYDSIGTVEARKEYDSQGRVQDMFGNGNPFSNFGGGRGFPGGGDIGDIFSQFMGGRSQQQSNDFGNNRSRREPERSVENEKGSDIES